MKLIAKKPCSFEGKQFYIGDEIPTEYVLDPDAQEKMGVLAQIEGQGEPEPPEVVVIPEPAITVIVDNMTLELSADGLQSVFDVLRATATEAEAIVQQMTDGDALILLHSADSRKGIKAVAEARAKAISEEVGEQ